jgi:hypothetical protein
MSSRYSRKYGSIPTTINGIKFHSQGEAMRDVDLCVLEKAGEIGNLRRQPKFVLQPAFTHRGERVAAITYTADWIYDEASDTVIEDWKGVETDVFKLKWKWMKRLYPQYVYRITGAR